MAIITSPSVMVNITSPSAMANITTLPIELLVEILLYFDYFELVKLRRVSRQFNEILTASTGTGALSKVLFRHKEDPDTPVNRDQRYCFELHPAIRLLVAKYRISDRYLFGFPGTPGKRLEITAVGLRNMVTNKFTRIKATGVGQEQAFTEAIPAEGFLNTMKVSGDHRSFALCFGARNEGLTVQQFAANLKGVMDWKPSDGKRSNFASRDKHHLLTYLQPSGSQGFSHLLPMHYLNVSEFQKVLGYDVIRFSPEKDIFAAKGYGSGFDRDFMLVFGVYNLKETSDGEEESEDEEEEED